MNPNIRRILFPVLVVAVFLLIRSFESTPDNASLITQHASSTEPAHVTSTGASQPATTTNALIINVVDGDTITALIDGQKEEVKVRLLGVNTPETVDPRRPVQCFGKEASKFSKTLMEGKRARLDPDLEADELDKYGRLLRNVVLEDGTDLNAQLIEQGYAYAYVTFPMNKQRRTYLKHLQDKAEQLQAGLWNPNTCNGQK